jgi:hypothetical protein
MAVELKKEPSISFPKESNPIINIVRSDPATPLTIPVPPDWLTSGEAIAGKTLMLKGLPDI